MKSEHREKLSKRPTILHSRSKNCQNCGRIPCASQFYFYCSRTDYFEADKKKQFPSPDYWISIYSEYENDSNCYSCNKLRGTMLNTRTNEIVAICTGQTIQDAPNPKDGCDKSEPHYSGVSDFNPRKRRVKE